MRYNGSPLFGQRDHQDVVAPLPLVADVHAFLAFAGRFDHRAGRVENRLVQELWWLLPPDLHASFIEDVLKSVDLFAIESPGEVACRLGIGDAAGTDRIEIDRVIPQRS